VLYNAKNINYVQNYTEFLHSLKPELMNLLKTGVQVNQIKFNLKLEATYSCQHNANMMENRAFKISAVEIFTDTFLYQRLLSGHT